MTFATSEIPSVKVNATYHIGTLQARNRGERGESLEGHLLSVSTCPKSWTEIAKINGPLHHFSKQEGALFLDVLGVLKNAELRDSIEQWAILQELVEKRSLWQVWIYDSEQEDWRFTLHGSKDLALNEIEDDEECGPDGVNPVEVELLVGTPKLGARVHIRDLSRRDSFEYAAMAWAEDMHPQFDGVWWREDFAPEALSAPRGGIFPSKIGSFQTKEISWDEAPDDEERGDLVDQPEAASAAPNAV
jgi:hypothetical protein